jgi:hypothetical protein
MSQGKHRLLRKLVVGVVAAAVFLITPYFLYDRLFGYQFGESQMRSAIEGTWTLEVTQAGATTRSLSFTIEQASAPTHSSREGTWLRSAAACGRRSFIRNAEACMDTSEMQLKLVAVGGGKLGSGLLRVDGKSFRRGYLDLDLSDLSVHAVVSSAGEVTEASANDGPVRLARVRPRS